jgi:hypothetical protein
MADEITPCDAVLRLRSPLEFVILKLPRDGQYKVVEEMVFGIMALN